MKIKQYFLMFAAVAVSVIALAYGVSPRWFARAFLGISELDLNVAHILRAVMCLYLALGAFWFHSAFSERHRNTAVLTCAIFAGGLVIGRLLSLFADGQPAPLLVFYTILELGLIPVAYWIYRLPE
jgi:Domain of unknown function (DUF4345)